MTALRPESTPDSRAKLNPRIALSAVLVTSAVLFAGIPRLSIDSSIASMTVEGDPDHATHDRFTKIFGSDEVLSIAIPFDDPFSPEALRLQRRISDRLAALPDVERVDSLATVDDISGAGSELSIQPLLPAGPITAETSRHVAIRAFSNSAWPGVLIASHRDAAAIQVQLLDSSGALKRRSVTMGEIEKILREELQAKPYYLAGHPFMKSEIASAITDGLASLLPACVLLMSATLLMTLDWRTAIAVLSLVLLAPAWMLGAMGWARLPLTAISNSGPAILLALATASFLHLPSAVATALAAGRDRDTALAAAVTATSRPVFLAGLTTLAGFSSLALSSVPIIRHFGLSLALGVLSVMVLALVAMPAALTLRLRNPEPVAFTGRVPIQAALRLIAGITSGRPRTVIAIAALLAIASAFCALNLRVDSSGPNKFGRHSRFRLSSDFYRTHFSGDVLENLYLAGPPGTFLDPDILGAMKHFEAAATGFPDVDKAVSVRQFIELLNKEFTGGNASSEYLPSDSNQVAQLLFLFESDSDELSQLIAPDYSAARIVLHASVPSSRASDDLRKRLRRLADHFLAAVPERDVVSTEILLSRAADRIALEQLRSTSVALVVIVAMIGLSFRSAKRAALMILPNLLPILLNLAVMSILQIPLSEATSIISATALGIAVDSSVHLVSASSTRGRSPRQAAIRGLITVGQPVVLAALVVIAGFLVLGASGFQAVSQLGLFTSTTMVYCLLADLFVMPAQVSLFGT